MRTKALPAALLAALSLATFAATPPSTINYQGVLRDAVNRPMNGTFDMTFAFYDAGTAGAQILVDQHTAATANAVTVSTGLFNVTLGGGTVGDGSGPGTYVSLSDVFRDFATVFLEVQVAGETLTPRTRVLGVPFALNATNLDGHAAAFFLSTSSAPQSKSGPLTLAAPASAIALSASGAGTGVAELGKGDYGIEARGSAAGGRFTAASGTGEALVGAGNYGVQGFGSSAGGFFQNSSSPGTQVSLAEEATAIVANGQSFGGHFTANPGSEAYVAFGQTGVAGYGAVAGGYFLDVNDGSEAWLAHAWTGIEAKGPDAGAYFFDSNGSGSAHVGFGDRGLWARGTFAGGTFSHPNGTTYWADVSTATRKIVGTGTVSFVQNHPYEADKVVVYAAPEGDEVAVYTRGHARLHDGRARVALGPTFALVANPDLGLTAHLTARGTSAALWVEDVNPRELLVRGPAGSDAAFDYLVYALRAGFEQTAIVQPKRREAFLPAAASIAAEYGGLDAERAASAQERFAAMRDAARLPYQGAGEAQRLTLAIGRAPAEASAAGLPSRETGPSGAAPPAHAAETIPSHASSVPPTPSPTERTGASAWPRLALSEPVAPGELLVLDPHRPGSLHRSTPEARGPVVGVAVEAGEHDTTVASCGIVALRVDAGAAPIAPGDPLVSSPIPGYAMRVTAREGGHQATQAPVIVGIALEPWAAGTGTIRALLSAP